LAFASLQSSDFRCHSCILSRAFCEESIRTSVG
jgi:hypothetical protein